MRYVICLQVKYYTDVHNLYSDLYSKLQSSVDSKCGDDETLDTEYDERVQQKLAEIRSLSITVDD